MLALPRCLSTWHLQSFMINSSKRCTLLNTPDFMSGRTVRLAPIKLILFGLPLATHRGLKKIPTFYSHQMANTRQFIECRIRTIRSLLHEISDATYAQRKTSPLALPLRNFSSGVTKDLKGYWYNDLDQGQIVKKLRAFKNRHQQTRDKTKGGYKDDKNLVFRPANDSECHGKAHPTGSQAKALFCGRFRFGVSLFPGFHFDVSPEKGSTIQCDLRTASGGRRSMHSERRRHINIFPNDFLLPKSKSGL